VKGWGRRKRAREIEIERLRKQTRFSEKKAEESERPKKKIVELKARGKNWIKSKVDEVQEKVKG
jgi:hypothetical protein